MTRPIVWIIAGTDSAGGAGLAADIKACEALDVHACTAVAALTAQHSQAVERVEAVCPDLLDAQLAALASDLPPAVIKTGMLGSSDNVRVVARWVRRLRQRADRPPVLLVVDPVLHATTGAALGTPDLLVTLRRELLPLADVVTPNRAEARALLGAVEPLTHDADVELAARALREQGSRAVVITGGDAMGGDADCMHDHCARDHLATPQTSGWLTLPRVPSLHHHGTGCTFAATLAAALARGFCEADAIVLAKMGTTHALRRGYAAGAGAGPVRPGPGFAADVTLLPDLHELHVPHDNAPAPRPAGFAALSDTRPGVYAIVACAEQVERVLHAGVRLVQLRIKDSSHPRLRDEIARSIALAHAAGAALFINDHWALAIELGAYGVHLGQDDLRAADLPAIHRAGLRLGLSTHSYWEVCRAWALRPSYLACGPIHATDSKAMPWLPQGAGNLAYWSRLLPMPVVGIGGMDAARVHEARRCGAAAAALISALTQAPDLAAACAAMQHAWQAGAQRAALPVSVPTPELARSTLPASRLTDLLTELT